MLRNIYIDAFCFSHHAILEEGIGKQFAISRVDVFRQTPRVCSLTTFLLLLS